MKAERSSARSSRVMSAAVALQMDTSSMLDTIGAVLPPSVRGIPEAELTPRVRDTIMAFLREMDGLKQELTQTRTRLDEVEKTADLDAVLPILNRRAFIRELTRYIAFTTRYSTPASLIYFDLNHLKQTNDTLGHAAGDALLAKFAKILLSHVRESDCVGRMGGDEFAILLSHASQGQALKKAMALADFAAKNQAQWNGHAIPISFAYGAFELKAGDKAEAAIAKADEAMYAQKRARRAAE
ncbi:MAG TPA: GGDEF domain-containing protein [Rhizomicrobium sp.]|jgi:diguanylate cyclase (GGDEF)-like protein|nr:GGDEF domain-containing protein [Rhizomicrobium sp.]